ncbi:MAG: hypothetical protein JWO86_1481 [Myxococcaceae bacterium]|nr:hypothetical protein [Myxococcaceae bacterium]
MSNIFGTHSRRPRFGFAVVTFGLLFASAACSLILNNDATQCSTDGDCAGFAAGAVCKNSVCVKAGTGTGPGTDGGDEGSTNGEGGPNAEAGPCQSGGFAGNPTTNAEFLNHCTAAQCLPFDNCAKLGLCGDAGLLPAVDPEGGAATSPPPTATPIGVCETLLQAASPGAVPIYVTGSSNFPGFLKLVAPLLAADNHYVIWQQTNSCTAVGLVFQAQSGVPDPTKQRLVDQSVNPKSQPTFYYDATGNQVPCTLDNSAAGTASHFVDVAESDVFADSCVETIGYHPAVPGPGPDFIAGYTGPIQAMTYLVPGASTQTAISAEAANAVYGHGGVPDTTKLPWGDPAQFFNRTFSTGTNQLVSRAMNVNPTKWWGVDKKSAAGMVTALEAVPSDQAEKTIGVVSTDLADQARGNLKVLAFQAAGQTCGFWPDSTPFATDKQNVRDGHYPIWGPLHFYTKLVAGAPTDPAGAFVLRFSLARLDQTLVEAIAKSGNVPQCAMHVTRDVEMGDLKRFTSPYDCDCVFAKAATGTAPAECQACATASSCPSSRPACNYGYCEKE